MTTERTLDVLGLDVVPDEELPAYSPTNSPEYQVQDPSTPALVYRLIQLGHKTQEWILQDTVASTRAVYQVRGRPSLHAFSREPDLAVSKVSQDASSGSTIGFIILDDDGPFPWRPRARVLHSNAQGATRVHRMESRNFADWSMTLGEAAYEHVWRLEASPVRLVLSGAGGAGVMAQFTWSSTGTLSKKGDDIGELVVYSGEVATNDSRVEAVLCSVLVPIAHFKRMGRRYWNAPATANRC